MFVLIANTRNFRVCIPYSSLLIFEALSLPPLLRSAPHQPEFQELHLENMKRANHNADTSTIASIESALQGFWDPKTNKEICRLLRLLNDVQSRIPKGFPGVNDVAKCDRAVILSGAVGFASSAAMVEPLAIVRLCNGLKGRAYTDSV
ncbi:hypothetical protein RHGRI_033567 [Rhododendron griersonianum]|uniref:Uncharacterized protein n=1 Tax=Rhododendron griersonianum TaxID=479676 RepID=A0AAV6HX94_9ERIC|nr:hypothetical protein RHGRI_033567 [Rhododendron griersonianum]